MTDLPKIDESYLDSQLQQSDHIRSDPIESDHIRSVVMAAETIKAIVTFIAVALVLAATLYASIP